MGSSPNWPLWLGNLRPVLVLDYNRPGNILFIDPCCFGQAAQGLELNEAFTLAVSADGLTQQSQSGKFHDPDSLTVFALPAGAA
jgi:hypothetical protein